MPLDTLWTLNMDVTPDLDIREASRFQGYVFWANYGGQTRVRCLITRETMDDYFHDRASERQAVAAIRKHWDTIWPIFQRKIADGQIENVSERRQLVRQVTLQAQDFGYQDFRKSA